MRKKLVPLGVVAFASTIAGIYALTRPNGERYKSKMPSYKKVFEHVQKWRTDAADAADAELSLRNPEDSAWWSERGKEFKEFYTGDWEDFRDKCFSEIKSAETRLGSIFGNSASVYSEAQQVTQDVISSSNFSFSSLCVYKNSSSG
ncbi:hypothetical protein HF1_04480 [Mycoplasma haemofelis str. Langford 1]|uniref:Uncharacterized protein n=1 Tax=Mycoplasma haemofelis (strain Langford 1) TaxID=941640 RepID=E8ZH35_MYCHL|nr:hypothetical protein [Mycoplasma haemofelis]CBY92456.1 hypothetical protein HF1_04480 [Mycoplasma haemofelis str. Langford 1]